MKNPRIYSPVSLKTKTLVSLDEGAAKHVGKVLRMQVGDSLRLFNGDGHDYTATISEVSKRSVCVAINAQHLVDKESRLHTHLGIAMSRGDRMDYVIQKSVELGVNEITPLNSERCELKLTGERAAKRLAHWQQVAVSACEQSGRAAIPKINEIQPFEAFVESDLGDSLGLVLHHRDTQQLGTLTPSPSHVTILIGPEGGLSKNEITQALQKGYKACTLGPRVFRTETAPVAALAVLQWLWGDFT